MSSHVISIVWHNTFRQSKWEAYKIQISSKTMMNPLVRNVLYYITRFLSKQYFSYTACLQLIQFELPNYLYNLSWLLIKGTISPLFIPHCPHMNILENLASIPELLCNLVLNMSGTSSNTLNSRKTIQSIICSSTLKKVLSLRQNVSVCTTCKQWGCWKEIIGQQGGCFYLEGADIVKINAICFKTFSSKNRR